MDKRMHSTGGQQVQGPRKAARRALPWGAMMRRNGWHMVKTVGGVTLARRWPPRFDVEATTRLPRLRARVLAHEVRKDLWRLLRSQRGFSPVVELTVRDGGVDLRAGGQIVGPVPGGLDLMIARMLETPALRQRWANHARLRTPARHDRGVDVDAGNLSGVRPEQEQNPETGQEIGS